MKFLPWFKNTACSSSVCTCVCFPWSGTSTSANHNKVGSTLALPSLQCTLTLFLVFLLLFLISCLFWFFFSFPNGNFEVDWCCLFRANRSRLRGQDGGGGWGETGEVEGESLVFRELLTAPMCSLFQFEFDGKWSEERAGRTLYSLTHIHVHTQTHTLTHHPLRQPHPLPTNHCRERTVLSQTLCSRLDWSHYYITFNTTRLWGPEECSTEGFFFCSQSSREDWELFLFTICFTFNLSQARKLPANYSELPASRKNNKTDNVDDSTT